MSNEDVFFAETNSKCNVLLKNDFSWKKKHNCKNLINASLKRSPRIDAFSKNRKALWRVNCFNRLRFLAEVSKTTTHEGNMKTRQMTPFFSFPFSALIVCNIYFCISKYAKFIFMWSPLWSMLVCKITQFLTKSYWFGQVIILF